jgi:acyl-coenzyme A synthetase/AMP-(fatty) acid ligase
VVLTPTLAGRPGDEISDELAGWVRSHLGSLKTPGRYVICDDLPLTGSGKVLRRVVRDRLAPDGAGAPISPGSVEPMKGEAL